MGKFNNIAARVMKPAANTSQVIKSDGITDDIITAIENTYNASLSDTALLAPYLKGANIMETCRNVFDFVFENITYKLDPFGDQWIKTPSRTWADKFADCKSISIFCASLLTNLGIGNKFRFTAYQQGSKIPTHIYVVVPVGKNEIIVDPVYKKFNKEKPYFFKTEIKHMPRIIAMAGIGEAPKPVDLRLNLGNKPIDQLTEGEMDLWIARDRLIAEKNIVEGIRGIGSLTAEKYQDSIDMINESLSAIAAFDMGKIDDIEEELTLIGEQAISGGFSLSHALYGIGDISERVNIRKKANEERRKLRTGRKAHLRKTGKMGEVDARVSATISGNFLKKVASTVKKGVKAVGKGVAKAAKTVAKVGVKAVKVVAKVVTAPVRLLTKGVLELALPKASPFFLYLFINDQKIIDKLPAKVREKRKKSEKIADFIVNAIGMQRKHFMGICRNGILKQYKKSPENVIADILKKQGITGLGSIVVTAVTEVISIIQKIASLFKKKTSEKISADDAPSDADWAELPDSTANILASNIKSQPENTSVLTQVTDGTLPEETNRFDSGGRSIWDSLKG